MILINQLPSVEYYEFQNPLSLNNGLHIIRKAWYLNNSNDIQITKFNIIRSNRHSYIMIPRIGTFAVLRFTESLIRFKHGYLEFSPENLIRL